MPETGGLAKDDPPKPIAPIEPAMFLLPMLRRAQQDLALELARQAVSAVEVAAQAAAELPPAPAFVPPGFEVLDRMASALMDAGAASLRAAERMADASH
jgi:hypothetical protein